MAVGPDEAAGTELDAAKVTGDDDSRIGQALLLEDFQDGPSCRAGRFAVIAGPLETAVGADLVGRAVVAGIPVFLFTSSMKADASSSDFTSQTVAMKRDFLMTYSASARP